MRIVIVDDEPVICDGLARILAVPPNGENWELVAMYHDTEEALEICDWEKVDLLLLDINMPGRNGLDLVETLRERECDILVVIISGYAQFEYARKAMLNSAVDFITKPVSIDKLFAALRNAQTIMDQREEELKNRSLIAENIDRLIRGYFGDMIFGTQDFSAAQKHDFCRKFHLEDKAYSIMALVTGEKTVDFSKLIRAADTAFRSSFYFYPAGAGLTVILSVLKESSHFDPSAFLGLARKYIAAIKWFESVRADTIDTIGASYIKLIQKIRDSGKTIPAQIERGNDPVAAVSANKNGYSLPVLQVIEVIDHDYPQPLSLTTLSDSVCVHPTYLSNLFKKQVGLALIDYINRYRIEKAKKLLEDPLNKIFWISERVGFMNQRYFSQVFKKIVGVTPVEYRSNFFLASMETEGQ